MTKYCHILKLYETNMSTFQIVLVFPTLSYVVVHCAAYTTQLLACVLFNPPGVDGPSVMVLNLVQKINSSCVSRCFTLNLQKNLAFDLLQRGEP